MRCVEVTSPRLLVQPANPRSDLVSDDTIDLSAKLSAQMAVKGDAKLQAASQGYIELLNLGGQIRMVDLTRRLLRKYLSRGLPILAGLMRDVSLPYRT